MSGFYRWRHLYGPVADQLLSHSPDANLSAGGHFIAITPPAKLVEPDHDLQWELPHHLGSVSGSAASIADLLQQVRREGLL